MHVFLRSVPTIDNKFALIHLDSKSTAYVLAMDASIIHLQKSLALFSNCKLGATELTADYIISPQSILRDYDLRLPHTSSISGNA